MSEKDKELMELEKISNSLKTQYGRMSTRVHMPIAIEGNDGLVSCGNKDICTII